MQLSDEQQKTVADWVAAGLSLSEVQDRLKSEFGVTLTYMEVRFLIDDLKIQLVDKPSASTAADLLAAAKQSGEAEREGASGGVSVTLDTVMKPQALVSGKVVFSDGQKAEWMLDQTGRLALNTATPGYRPSQEDVLSFQEQLQRVIQGMA